MNNEKPAQVLTEDITVVKLTGAEIVISEESPQRRKRVRIKVTYLAARGYVRCAGYENVKWDTAVVERIGPFSDAAQEIMTQGFGLPQKGNVIIPPSAIIRIEVVE